MAPATGLRCSSALTRGMVVILGSHIAEGLRRAGGRDRDRSRDGERQSRFRVNDRRVIPRHQDAGDTGRGANTRADRRAGSPTGDRADHRADGRRRGNRADLLTGRGRPALPADELRPDRDLRAVSQRHAGQLEREARRPIGVRLLRFRDAAVDHLIPLRDHDAVHHDRLGQAGDERVTRLVAIG